MPYDSTSSKISIKHIRQRATLSYMISTMLIVIVASMTMLITLGKISDNKESQLLESTALELSRTINNYLQERESECNDVFRNEIITAYSPSGIFPNESEFEREQRMNAVKQELSRISAGKCYNDFFIIYSDSTTVGNVSQGAVDIASAAGYGAFSDALGESQDIWSFGTISGLNKIFYLRRMNESSIFVLSCYIDNLDVIFPVHDNISAVNYALTDNNDRIIISDLDRSKVGDDLPSVYKELFHSENEVVIDDYYIGARTRINSGWYIYAVTSNSDFIPNYTIIAAIAGIAFTTIIILCYVTGLLCFSRLAAADEQYAESEYIDTITGKLNEYGLDEKISDMLETSLIGSTYAFIIIGIKDSEQIKSTVSLRYWNDIRMKLADKAEAFFEKKSHYIGRVYDDYIVVFADYSEFDLFKAHTELEQGCEQLWNSFKDFTVGAEGELKLGVVIGACVYPDHGDDFDSLLGKARQAYKTAAAKDDKCFTVYKNRDSGKSKEEKR